MDKMKLRFTNAVASRLSAAPHSTAKTELIEELSDNLYRRYQDMVASGMEENAAFDRSLDELGDVDELLDYLKGLDPEEELPQLTLHPYEEQERTRNDLENLLDSVDEIVKGAMGQAKQALDRAKEAMRQTGQSAWRSDDGRVEIHFDDIDDDHGEHPSEPNRPTEPAGGTGWQFSVGYDRAKGGFFAESTSTLDASGGPIPSQGLRGVDIQTVNGDVAIHLLDGPEEDIRLEGDVDQLEMKVTDKGVLAIRQGRTASSSFFFRRGLSCADVELYLPRRPWEFIQVSAVNGDVSLDEGFQLDRLSVKTTSGGLSAPCAACGRLYFKSASGDAQVSGLTGSAQVETMSGDVRVQGHMDRVSLSSMSGDVELEGTAEEIRLSSMSGDVRLETPALPASMELSSKSGDCQARIPDAGPFTVRCRTPSGEVRSDFSSDAPHRSGTFTRQGPEGQTGGPVYSVSSVSGDVELWRY